MSNRRRGLGRGLDALLTPVPDALSTVAQLLEVPVDALHPNPDQPRTDFDPDDLEELSASIREQGILQPIVAYADGSSGYVIIAGERRWRAARMAGRDLVPVLVRQAPQPAEQLLLALVENLQRADLGPLEEARAYAALREEFALSQEQIAKQVGKSRAAVANTLRLLRLPEDVQAHLRSGRLTAGQARPLLAAGTEEMQIGLANRAIKEDLSAREIERLVRPAGTAGSEGAKGKRSGDPPDVHDRAAVEQLTRRLQSRVQLRRGAGRGQIVIHFHSEPELIRLVDLLLGREEDANVS